LGRGTKKELKVTNSPGKERGNLNHWKNHHNCMGGVLGQQKKEKKTRAAAKPDLRSNENEEKRKKT